MTRKQKKSERESLSRSTKSKKQLREKSENWSSASISKTKLHAKERKRQERERKLPEKEKKRHERKSKRPTTDSQMVASVVPTPKRAGSVSIMLTSVVEMLALTVESQITIKLLI